MIDTHRNDFDAVARLLHGLSDPNRLRIIRELTMDCQSVSAIVDATGLPQPLVSHHLRVLRQRGLARPERRGAYTFYCLSDDSVAEAIAVLGRLSDRLRRLSEAAAVEGPALIALKEVR
jgi:ArsR family transcriptional regulator